MPFPSPARNLVGKPLMYLVFALIGFAFGFVLEISGFGNSAELAAQFYFKDLTVLKVMFTAIIVAMVLIFSDVRSWYSGLQPGLGQSHLSVARHRWRADHGRRLYDRRLLSRHLAGRRSTFKIDGLFLC